MNDEMHFLVIKSYCNNQFKSCIANKETFGGITVELTDESAKLKVVNKYYIEEFRLDPKNKIHKELLLNLDRYLYKKQLLELTIKDDVVRIENSTDTGLEVMELKLDKHNSIICNKY